MSGLEGAALTLGALVVKSAAKLWVGKDSPLADASTNVVDGLAGRLRGEIEKAKLRSFFTNLEIRVAERLGPIIEREFRDIPDKEAAVDAVRSTFAEAALTDDDLFRYDLNPGRVHHYLVRVVPGVPEKVGLSEAGAGFYHRLMLECCACLVQIRVKLASFSTDALVEILERQHRILEEVEKILREMRSRSEVGDPRVEYLEHVRTVLDRITFFGARMPDSNPSKHYPLSVAYLSLSMEHGDTKGLIRAEDALGRANRLLIRGEAGSGKTTLLQWIAVRCAAGVMPREMADWTGVVPFLVPLRRYAQEAMPRPKHFLDEVGPRLIDDVPETWVKERLEAGGAVVLIDGVDELPESRRTEVWTWLERITSWFPEARYVVTSRPAAAESDWLRGLGFQTAELRPMTQTDVHEFVGRWHDAMRADCPEEGQLADLDAHESGLLDAIAANRGLRRIATSPLLCALLCALQRDRGELPTSRMDLYLAALDMLLGRRDFERLIPIPQGLNFEEQRVILQDLAYWMVRNNRVDVALERAVERIGATMESLVNVSAPVEEVLRHLLERSGLLRQPVVGRLDFVHRTFQDFLAAKAATEADDIGVLIDNAHRAEWRDVVVMAVGHANRAQRDEIIRALLNPGRSRRRYSTQLTLLALACLETASDVDPALLDQINERASDLIPPKDEDTAESIVRGGELTLDLLARNPATGSSEVLSTVRAALAIGGDEAIGVLEKYASHDDAFLHDLLVRGWPQFSAVPYAKRVLSKIPSDLRLEVYLGYEETPIPLPGLVMPHLDRLPEVTSLTLRPIGDPPPLYLAGLPMLPALEVLRVHLPSIGWESLAEFPGLRWLSLDHSPDEDPAVLQRCSNLAHLTAYQWNGGALRRLPSSLSSLALMGCDIHSVAGLPELPSLVGLTLRDCPPVDLSALRGRPVRVALVLDQKVTGAEGVDIDR